MNFTPEDSLKKLEQQKSGSSQSRVDRDRSPHPIEKTGILGDHDMPREAPIVRPAATSGLNQLKYGWGGCCKLGSEHLGGILEIRPKIWYCPWCGVKIKGHRKDGRN